MLIAHISDVHLGRKSLGDPQGAERLGSLRQAITTISRSRPDAIVIAGDTFDSPQVDRAVIEEAAKTLETACTEDGQSIPIVLIPGNHDPADADKLWTTFEQSLDSRRGVHLVREARVVRLLDGMLLFEAYPCPTRFSVAPPWEPRLHIEKQDGRSVHVVVAHGTLQGGPVPEGEIDAYPFTLSEVTALGADYVALGHFHGVYPMWGDGDACERPYSYSGTHEPDQFSGDSGFCILATLIPGMPAQLRRVRVGRRHWRLITLERPSDLVQIEHLLAELRNGCDPARFVIRLKFRSSAGWTAAEISRFEGLENSLRALGSNIERRGDIRACVDVQTLDLTAIPSGAVKEALLSLKRDYEDTSDSIARETLAAALQIGWDHVQESMAP